ncbi:MAG: TrkH family potassium uptake protein [Coriobacteriia bacterium]|nr:TrkH family potassium uptake protein [Coriobacteriia bacterium]
MWVGLHKRDLGAIAHYTGLLVSSLALAMLIPLVTALVAGEWGPALDYVCGIGVAAAVGMLLALQAPRGVNIGRRDALIVTALAWLVASFVAAVPLSLSGNYGSFLDAFFDAISGLTTSGLTLVQDLDHMALAHNMWRHLTHLIGGQGIIVAALSVALGLKGGGAMSLYMAEGRDERILPNVMHTARFIWFVTAIYVTFGTLALSINNVLHGMELGRSVLHAFWATAACYDTGGFGPQSQNALYYHSPFFESITVILMLAGTLNFNLHADLWRGDRTEIFKNLEARALAVNIGILSLAVGLGLAATGLFSAPGELLRKGLYHLISANSGTGHQTIYTSQWIVGFGGLAFGAIILAMAFGGMASSTAGGIKALRLGLIVKGVILRVRQAIAPPSSVVTDKYHHLLDVPLTADVLANALMVFTLYTVTYISGGMIGAAYGYPMGEALFESVSATANVGLSTGITNPAMPMGLKLVYIVQMWAGRLEFIALFALVASVVASLKSRRSPS